MQLRKWDVLLLSNFSVDSNLLQHASHTNLAEWCALIQTASYSIVQQFANAVNSANKIGNKMLLWFFIIKSHLQQTSTNQFIIDLANDLNAQNLTVYQLPSLFIGDTILPNLKINLICNIAVNTDVFLRSMLQTHVIPSHGINKYMPHCTMSMRHIKHMYQYKTGHTSSIVMLLNSP